MALSDVKLRGLRASGKHSDGGGLYLEVTQAGGRYWRVKYRHAGKEKRLALGVYPAVPLKLARERRDAARLVMQHGGDPAALWQRAEGVRPGARDFTAVWLDAAQHLAAGRDPVEAWRAQQLASEKEAAHTFESVAREWLQHRKGSWSARTHDMTLASFKTHVFPRIGMRPLAQLRPRDLVEVAQRVEASGAGEAALRVMQRMKAVFRHAAIHERLPVNPMADMRPGELLKPREVRHRASVTEAQLPQLLRAMVGYDGHPTVKAALWLLLFTVVRPGELRAAQWAEFDLQRAAWRIPAAHMKMKAEHLVPLSRQAVEGLRLQHKATGGAGLVFPSPWYPEKPISDGTLNSALARMGFKGMHTAHGFRSLFTTVANEHGHDKDAIERQLAHIEQNEVRAAYHRGQYLQQRATLMQWWADYVDAKGAAG